MFGKLWTWLENAAYAALTRGTQRWIDDMSKPVQGIDGYDLTAEPLKLTFKPPDETPAKRRKAEGN